jgi:hypothetical protein
MSSTVYLIAYLIAGILTTRRVAYYVYQDMAFNAHEVELDSLAAAMMVAVCGGVIWPAVVIGFAIYRLSKAHSNALMWALTSEPRSVRQGRKIKDLEIAAANERLEAERRERHIASLEHQLGVGDEDECLTTPKQDHGRFGSIRSRNRT